EEPERDGDSYSRQSKAQPQQQEDQPGVPTTNKLSQAPVPKATSETMRAAPATETKVPGVTAQKTSPPQAASQKPPLVLGERAQILKERFDAAMPWSSVDLTEKAARHFETMAAWPDLVTEEQFRSGLEWHQDHYPGHVGYSPGNYVKDRPIIQAERYAAERAK